MFDLPPPRHISTLRYLAVGGRLGERPESTQLGRFSLTMGGSVKGHLETLAVR